MRTNRKEVHAPKTKVIPMRKEPKMRQKKTTTDAIEIIHKRFFEGKPERLAELEKIRADDAVARKIYDLRTRAGLSQRALAKLVGTTASAICRLEDADYEGHSLAMMNRIAAALNRRVEIRFVPLKGRAKHPVPEQARIRRCACSGSHDSRNA
jgi:DNA-binding XRE family transcriptional regulator